MKDWAFLLGFLIFAVLLTISSWDYPFITALYPRLLLTCGFILCGVKIGLMFRNKAGIKNEDETGEATSNLQKKPINMWIYLGCGFLYTLLMPILGFILSTLLTLVVLFGLFRVKTIINLTIALSTSLVLYVIFVIALDIPLPKGIIENMLF